MNSVETQYRRNSFREIRACTEMDLIRKAMARREERERKRKKAMREGIFLLAAFVAAVSAAVWILR